MRCHKCNQDSIKIVMDDEIHIKCDICGLDIDCGVDNPILCELFIYNEGIEAAVVLGKEAYNGDGVRTNPYSLDSDQIILHKSWDEGWDREKLVYEFSALTLSAEKIEGQLRTEIRALIEAKSALEEKIKKFIPPNCKYIDNFCANLLGRAFVGRILSKDVHSFLNKYRAFHRDVFDTWKYPD